MKAVALLLIGTAVASAMAPTSHIEAWSAMRSAHAKLQSLIKLQQDDDVDPATLSAPCRQAFMTAAQSFASCENTMSSIGDIMSPCGTATAEQRTTALNSFCSSTCRQSLLNLAPTLTAACTTDADKAIVKTMTMVGGFLELPCIKLNGELCYLKLMSGMAAFGGGLSDCSSGSPPSAEPATPAQSGGVQTAVPADSSDGSVVVSDEEDPFEGPRVNLTLTNAQMEQLCSPCTFAIITRIGQLMPESAPVFDHFNLICLKSGNTFCYPKIMQNFQMIGDLGEFQMREGSNEITAYRTRARETMSTVCADQCMPMFFARMVQQQKADFDREVAKAALEGTEAPAPPTEAEIRERDETLRRIGALCTRNDAGQYCYAEMFTVDQAYLIALNCGDGDKNATASCPADCKTAINGYISALGCCARERLNYQADADLDAWVSAPTACGITIPESCPRPLKKVGARIVISNIRKAWIDASDANKAKFIAAVIADISASTGAPITAIRVTRIEAVGGVSGSSRTARVFAVSASNGVAVFIEVDAATDDQATSMQVALNGQISTGAIALEAVSALPTDAKQIPSAAVAVDTRQSASVSCTDNCETATDFPDAGVAVAPTLLVALVAALAAFLRM